MAPGELRTLGFGIPGISGFAGNGLAGFGYAGRSLIGVGIQESKETARRDKETAGLFLWGGFARRGQRAAGVALCALRRRGTALYQDNIIVAYGGFGFNGFPELIR